MEHMEVSLKESRVLAYYGMRVLNESPRVGLKALIKKSGKKIPYTMSDQDFNYVCELKYDGVSISLTYKNGELIQALTRGDGDKGDNVTSNVKTIKSVPLKLKGDYP